MLAIPNTFFLMRGNSWPLPLLSVGILSGLNSCSSCACCHSPCVHAIMVCACARRHSPCVCTPSWTMHGEAVHSPCMCMLSRSVQVHVVTVVCACAQCHDLCIHMCITPIVSRTAASLEPSTTSVSNNISPPLSHRFLSLKGRCVVKKSHSSEWLWVGVPLFAHSSLVSLCVYHHLPQKEPSRMRAEWGTDLWVEQHVFRSRVIALFT